MYLTPDQKALVASLTPAILTNPVAMVKAIETARPGNGDVLLNALETPVIKDAGFVDRTLFQTVAKRASVHSSYHANHLMGIMADHRSDLIDRPLLQNHIGAIRSKLTDAIWSACVMVRKRPDLMDSPLLEEFAGNANSDNRPANNEIIKTIGDLIVLRPELASDRLVTILVVPSLSSKNGEGAMSSIVEARPDLKQALADEYLKLGCKETPVDWFRGPVHGKKYDGYIAAIKSLGLFIHENPECASPSLVEKLLETGRNSASSGYYYYPNNDTMAQLAISVVRSVGLIVQVRPELADQPLVFDLIRIIQAHTRHLIPEQFASALDSIGMIAETRPDLMNEGLIEEIVESSPKGWDQKQTTILLKVAERIFEKKLPHPDDDKWIEGIVKIDQGGSSCRQSKKILDGIVDRRPDLKFWVLNAG